MVAVVAAVCLLLLLPYLGIISSPSASSWPSGTHNAAPLRNSRVGTMPGERGTSGDRVISDNTQETRDQRRLPRPSVAEDVVSSAMLAKQRELQQTEQNTANADLQADIGRLGEGVGRSDDTPSQSAGTLRNPAVLPSVTHTPQPLSEIEQLLR